MRHVAGLAMLGALCALSTHHAQAQHVVADWVKVTPSELKWAATSVLPYAQTAVIEGPANEAVPFTVRVKFPANSKVPPHAHTAIEHVTVISGVLNLGVGEKFDTTKTTALGPGSVSIMQPGTRHFAWCAEETIIQLHGVGPWTVTYVNPADDPRKK